MYDIIYTEEAKQGLARLLVTSSIFVAGSDISSFISFYLLKIVIYHLSFRAKPASRVS